jgi:hypothetical protein
LFYECIGPDEFSVEQILLCLLRLDCALADNYPNVSIQTHPKIVDFEFAETDVAGHRLQVSAFAYDPAVRPDDCAVFRLNPSRVRTITFDSRFRPFMLNLDKRLFVL